MLTFPYISFDNISVKLSGKQILDNISLSIFPNQAWAITGPTGSGKTTLGKILAGVIKTYNGTVQINTPRELMRTFVSQQHDFRHLYSGKAYYQQRFDSNYNSDSPLLKQVLFAEAVKLSVQEERFLEIVDLLKFAHLLDSRIIELSNGEGKRLQLALALMGQPEVLVLDNPFIGLDKDSRASLNETLENLNKSEIMLFVISSEREMPSCITHIAALKEGRITFAGEKEGYKAPDKTSTFKLSDESFKHAGLPQEEDFEVAVEMRQVTVVYNEKVILDNISWKVNKGERWSLTGPNGAGKSTLLSLILADNPHGYFNELYLFDRKRGSGESVWDIKKRIGYVSPELHLFFQRSASHIESVSNAAGTFDVGDFSLPKISCFEVVASGLHEQIGSSKEITKQQEKKVMYWMELLEIAALKKENYNRLSLGTQRLILLTRALVKNSPLLILDEPCQGLDGEQVEKFKRIVDFICLHFNKTLIYVSHYPNEIPSCVDRHLVLENGKVIP